jgi:hypothetical protein
VSKFEIARTIIERLNDQKDTHLRELREVVRRVTEFEDFSTCWESDQLKAKGLVAEIRRVVNVKDSFTRMRMEQEAAAKKSRQESERRTEIAQKRTRELEEIKAEFFALFAEPNAQRRGKALEGILNRIFKAYGMLVREAFTVKGTCGEGVIEQIDGVIEIDSHLYLVEMKWWNTPIGVNDISPHLVRVYSRGAQARGIFLSYTDYTGPAIETCRQAIAGGAVVTLCKLSEIVAILELGAERADLQAVLRDKIHVSVLDKNPWKEYLPLI